LSAKRLLLEMLDDRADELAKNQEMSAEVNSLLGTEVVRGSKSLVMFESNTKELRDKLCSPNLDDKIAGFNELFEVFASCFNLSDQLQIFASKCQPLLKAALSGPDFKIAEAQNHERFPEFLRLVRALIT